jgi:hypothetical protein
MNNREMFHPARTSASDLDKLIDSTPSNQYSHRSDAAERQYPDAVVGGHKIL